MRVKGIEEHLGITTSAIKGYEKKGLIQTFGGELYNKGNKTRQYTADDIETMWLIKVLQSVGFTLQEISEIKENKEDKFFELLELKIQQLEADIAIRDYFLGYAKEIKLIGRIPVFPEELGSITWNEYYNKIINECNIHTNAQSKDKLNAKHLKNKVLYKSTVVLSNFLFFLFPQSSGWGDLLFWETFLYYFLVCSLNFFFSFFFSII